MKSNQHSQRSMKLLRSHGFVVEMVEKFVRIPGAGGYRKDLYGCIDAVASHPKQGIVGVQMCRRDAISGHFKKLLDDDDIKQKLWTFLKAGQCCPACGETINLSKFEIHGWRKPEGKRRKWDLQVRNVTIADLGFKP